jgi:hypothetical protein
MPDDLGRGRGLPRKMNVDDCESDDGYMYM